MTARQTSQKASVKGYLLTGNSITPVDALNWFGCFRLAAIIHTLRAEGMVIKTETVDKAGKRYAKYFLDSD